MVRCKMVVKSRTEYMHSPGGEVSQVQVALEAVHGKDNASWSKFTPSGLMSLTITNPEAYKRLELGGTYFLDFSPAPATEAGESK